MTLLENIKRKRDRKMMAAYWHKDGLDVYSFTDEKPVRFASGAPESLQPIKRGFGIKVLVVGRDRLMHIRKRYPPAPKEKLTKAVALEIGEIFPLSKPAFYCRIFRSVSNYVELDIWAWESDAYEKLREIFPFSHVVPEDVLFTAEEPEVGIFQRRDLVHMLAHAKSGYLDSASVPLAAFDDAQVSRFLFNLVQVGQEIKKIRIYGLQPFRIKEPPGIMLVRSEETIYPPCMAGLAHCDLKEFRIRGDYRFVPRSTLVLRIGLYLILGYGLLLFLTMKNYDQAATDIRQRIAALDKKAVALDASRPSVDYTDVSREINEKLQKGQQPLGILNMLAQTLPEGSFINRMVLTENLLELSLSSKEPLTVIKLLGNGKTVKKVAVKGAPSRDGATGRFNFAVTMELSR